MTGSGPISSRCGVTLPCSASTLQSTSAGLARVEAVPLTLLKPGSLVPVAHPGVPIEEGEWAPWFLPYSSWLTASPATSAHRFTKSSLPRNVLSEQKVCQTISGTLFTKL